MSGEAGMGEASIGSDSSVDTSTTVSVITSGLMAAWINSEGRKKKEYLIKFLPHYCSVTYMKLF